MYAYVYVRPATEYKKRVFIDKTIHFLKLTYNTNVLQKVYKNSNKRILDVMLFILTKCERFFLFFQLFRVFRIFLQTY